MVTLTDGRCLRVALRGRVDYAALPRLRPMVRDIADTPHRCLRIDLSGVDFVDSCGIGLLLTLRSLVAERGGRVGFENHTPRVRRILERSGVAALLAPVMGCSEPEPLPRAA
ncbi:STAS domain-containing protein [Azospirillum rugosum]|uniref:Anti-anti-sigma factor n=1 Tax=Azospirillum rugosum TaxID=416170 RepID=A0ABS4SQA8_9PROT|nr:STAS domain-containing protein [Azospirillum rugosum]MBP2293575.1 anti-anti-sigma factor [Azospirillum rugosum]MDQ0529254.1 anti-anti-sigma factor [Azospirillum rugosum]